MRAMSQPAWVELLSLIVSMPIVISPMKKPARLTARPATPSSTLYMVSSCASRSAVTLFFSNRRTV